MHQLRKLLVYVFALFIEAFVFLLIVRIAHHRGHHELLQLMLVYLELGLQAPSLVCEQKNKFRIHVQNQGRRNLDSHVTILQRLSS